MGERICPGRSTVREQKKRPDQLAQKQICQIEAESLVLAMTLGLGVYWIYSIYS
jgi:hypothetical protein